jgi:ribonuclease-3
MSNQQNGAHISQTLIGESRTEFIARFLKSDAFVTIAKILDLDLNEEQANHMVCSFCHRSFINESQLKLESYERYEFLGDALLELLTTETLYQKYPELSEGELSKFRSSLVCEEALNELTDALPFSDLILIGNGERKRNGHLNPALRADVFEAFLGALYIIADKNFATLKEQFSKIINYYNQQKNKDYFAKTRLESFDAKTKFQEITMKRGLGHPLYKALEIAEGTFEVSLVINEIIVKRLIGYSKKKTEKELAAWALEEGDALFSNIQALKGEEDATS